MITAKEYLKINNLIDDNNPSNLVPYIGLDRMASILENYSRMAIEESEALKNANCKSVMSKITVIHPSRERAEQCYKTAKMFLDNAETDVRYIVSVDLTDPTLKEYLDLFDKLNITIDINDNYSAITAVNTTAEKVIFDVVVVLSDDFVCDKGWDTKILEATDGFTDWVLKTNDGTEGWIVTLPIMDWYFYKRFGYIYNPAYQHLFCDTELTHIADITGKLIVRNDIVIKQTLINDTRKALTNQSWAQGERIYISRVITNFDIPDIAIVNQLTHQPHIDWLSNKMREYGHGN